MDIPYGLVMRGLLKQNNKILILRRHPKSRTNPNRWEFPGGKVDPGEDFDKALIREFLEETNLNIKIGDLIGAVQEDFPHKRTVTIVMGVEDIHHDPNYHDDPNCSYGEIYCSRIEISDEHTDYKWATIDEIKELDLSGNLSGWFKKLLKLNDY